jgi:hypothetical protein
MDAQVVGESVNSTDVSLASCDVVVPGDAAEIQAGVDAAAAGETVCVKGSGGPYHEQVVINKDLVLHGIDSPVIEAPGDPTDYEIPESTGSTWEPIVFAFGGTEAGGTITGSGVVDVSVSGFSVDGRDRDPGARAVGIFFRNVQSSGGITNNDVHSMGVGGKETFGILAYGDTDVTIADNSVSEYERGGIGANGDGGAHPAPDVQIANNDITGSTGIGEAWGPNGIQVGFGASGKIADNTVQDNRYSADGQVASCILVFESDGVQVQDNEAGNCDAGIAVGTWGWFLPSADNVKVTGNAVQDANAAVVLRAVAFDGLSMTDPSVSNGKVTNNDLVGDSGDPNDVGIAITTIDADPDYDPLANNNKIIRNSFSDFGTNVEEDGTSSKVAANEPAFSP